MRRRKIGKFLFILAALCLLVAAFCWWQNNGLMLTRYTVTLEGLPPELEGLTVVQLSDLHNKRMGEGQSTLLDKVAQAQPDLIVLTGDLVDSVNFRQEPALELARGVAALAPTYFVTGNHEMALPWAEYRALAAELEEAGVILLDDAAVQVSTPGGGTLLLAGLANSSLKDDTLERMAGEFPEGMVTLLLAHQPQYLEKYAAAGVDLVFSGHAHGGQIRLPLLGGLVAPGQGYFPKYTQGIYRLGDTEMVVSRGIGNSRFPLRLLNRPEVVAVTLTGGEG